MDAWMYGCMDAWMYGCMDVCRYELHTHIFEIYCAERLVGAPKSQRVIATERKVGAIPTPANR